MPDIAETLESAGETLRQSGIPDPRREARSLLAFAIKKDAAFLFAHPEYELTATEQENMERCVRRRAQREPFQYITGIQEFCGLEFAVSKDVLIPRPETEMLVEESVALLSGIHKPIFCEVGVGSGCISVSILSRVVSATGIGLDISEKALAVAAENARAHIVDDRLELVLSDVFEAFTDDFIEVSAPDGFDLIVSNPPYVPRSEIAGLQAEVRDFEPAVALTDGADGLSIVQRIVGQSPGFLSPGGHILIEIGFGQAEDVLKMFTPTVWSAIEFLPDLQGIPRMVKARKTN